ncbi:MAG: MGH1-like glycoside hydrolase domain-containing protein [Planctomycetota bacterium]|jgi:hypothetical protein
MTETLSQSRWLPLSTSAYAANAVFIPGWGKKKAFEWILIMYQNYPDYRTHSAIDYFQKYTVGAERFQQNHNFRVLGWEFGKSGKEWSFRYLPELPASASATVLFSSNTAGRLRIDLELDNRETSYEREWQFCLMCCPLSGLELPDYNLLDHNTNSCRFSLAETEFTFNSHCCGIKNIYKTDSSLWHNFPTNIETSGDPDNPADPDKKRLRIDLAPVTIGASSAESLSLEILAGAEAENSEKPVSYALSEIPEENLPFQHLWWETWHNRQYVRSLRNSEKFTDRVIPARQWKRLFLWDNGMTAVGALEMDRNFAENIITEMPDPELDSDSPFAYSSPIATAVYALWEMQQPDPDIECLKKHYPHLKRLVEAIINYPEKYSEKSSELLVTSPFNKDGIDDSPAIVYAKGEIFSWDYDKTLPVNKERSQLSLHKVGLTSHAVRQLKILRLTAHILGIEKDCSELTAQIENMEEALNQKLWCEDDKCYYDFVVEESRLYPSRELYHCLPLFSGSAPGEKEKLLLADIFSEKRFLTPFGLTAVSQDSPYYRRDGYWNGAVWIPPQWFFWKALYNTGLPAEAAELADKVLNLWEKNHNETLCCWEKFQVHDGHGAGNSRFSGLSTPLLALWKARRQPGRLQMSQDLICNDKVKIDYENNYFFGKFSAPYYSGPAGISIVLKPKQRYRIYLNEEIHKDIESDKWGFVALTLPEIDSKEVSIEIKAE